jgi:hypothetical protein
MTEEIEEIKELKDKIEELEEVIRTIYNHCCNLYCKQEGSQKVSKRSYQEYTYTNIPLNPNESLKYREGFMDMAREVLECVRSHSSDIAADWDKTRRTLSGNPVPKRVKPGSPIISVDPAPQERIPGEAHLQVDHGSD